MVLEYSAIPLAWIAGVLSILSPCVWPMVPIVMGSASGNSHYGPVALAAGLSLAFALAGSVLSFILVNTGTDPEIFRYIAAMMLVFVGAILIIKPMAEWLTLKLSLLTARLQPSASANEFAGQFGVGFLLGLVWLPCVGPMLGAAIALASEGQDMLKAFVIMLFFGMGTAMTLGLAALLSNRAINAVNGKLFRRVEGAKWAFGALLVTLGLFVLTGVDKALEIWAMNWLPEWAYSL